jgi:hypothetical protein
MYQELSYGQDPFVQDPLHSLSETFPLQPLTLQLAGAADGFGSLTRTPFRRLFVVSPEFHFPEYAFALHLLFERFERLVDVVIAN